jgi:hypothetical protein
MSVARMKRSAIRVSVRVAGSDPHSASAFALRASADLLARNPPWLAKRAKTRSLHAAYITCPLAVAVAAFNSEYSPARP